MTFYTESYAEGYTESSLQKNTKNQAGNLASNKPMKPFIAKYDLFKPQAERRVKLGLIVGEVIRQKDVKRDQERVEAMLNTLAASYEDPEALISYYRSNAQAMQTVEAAVMEEMIVDSEFKLIIKRKKFLFHLIALKLGKDI